VWFQLGNGTANLSKRSPAVFFTVINQSLFGAMKSILVFPELRRTLMRERRARLYTTLPGFLSWSLADMLFSIPWSITFVLITYFMIGLRTDSAGHFFIFLVVLVLDKIVASSMAVMVCTWTTNPSVPTVVLPVVLELSRLFGGFFLPPALLPTYFEWLDPLSYVKYAYLAVANNELQDLLICAADGSCSTAAANRIITTNKLDYLTAGPCIGVLIAFIVFTRTVAYLFLLFKKH
jgi:ABC-type multidrug transport system permease subunit